MGHETARKRLQKLKFRDIAAVTLALCVGMAIVVSWSAGFSSSPCQGAKIRDAWTRPRSLAAIKGSPSNNHSTLSPDWTAKLGWERHAIANLTNYRDSILSLVRPHYGKQGYWSIFKQVVSCPPDRPLTRYGGTDDGSKLLCRLSGSLQRAGCVIYSLGSNGEGSCQTVITHLLSSEYEMPRNHSGDGHYLQFYRIMLKADASLLAPQAVIYTSHKAHMSLHEQRMLLLKVIQPPNCSLWRVCKMSYG